MNTLEAVFFFYKQQFIASPAMFVTANVMLGLLVGSFLNVVAIRVPAKQSVVSPPSHCPCCKHRLSAMDLIPVISYLMLRGRCRTCKQPFTGKYAIWEAITGLLFGITALVTGPTLEWLVQLFFISILIVITQTDLDGMIIPDKVVLFGLVGGFLLRLFIHDMPISRYVIGFAVGGGTLLAIGVLGQWILKKEAMGGGDVKLFAFIGLMLGSQLTLLALFTASLIGLIIGLLLIGTGRMGRDRHIPFGPFIAVGSWISCLWGSVIIESYIRIFLV